MLRDQAWGLRKPGSPGFFVVRHSWHPVPHSRYRKAGGSASFESHHLDQALTIVRQTVALLEIRFPRTRRLGIDDQRLIIPTASRGWPVTARIQCLPVDRLMRSGRLIDLADSPGGERHDTAGA